SDRLRPPCRVPPNRSPFLQHRGRGQGASGGAEQPVTSVCAVIGNPPTTILTRENQMRLKVVFAVISLVCCLTAAPASSAPPANPSGPSLRVGLAQTPDALDPLTALTSSAFTVLHQICEPLYNLDANGAVLPALATSLPKVSANRLIL